MMTCETPENREMGRADKDIALFWLSMSYTTRSNSQKPAILMRGQLQAFKFGDH